MATPLTRQDMLAISDSANKNIVNRLLTRRDVQLAADNARDRILNTINAFHVESQALIRQSGSQNDQMWRRISSLESQIVSARQDIRVLTQAFNRLYDYQIQQINRLNSRPQAAEPSEPGFPI